MLGLKNMFRLEDWIVESEVFKTCFNKGPRYEAVAAVRATRETRSMPAGWRAAWPRTAFAFAWRI